MTGFDILVAGQAAGSGGLDSLLSSPMVPMLIFMVFMIFIMFRSQQKESKRKQEMLKSIKTGDKVVTTSGIHGMIANVKESTYMLKIADNVKIEINKANVAGLAQDKDKKTEE